MKGRVFPQNVVFLLGRRGHFKSFSFKRSKTSKLETSSGADTLGTYGGTARKHGEKPPSHFRIDLQCFMQDFSPFFLGGGGGGGGLVKCFSRIIYHISLNGYCIPIVFHHLQNLNGVVFSH